MPPATETVRARIDSETKHRASMALEAMGLSVSDAIRLLMVQIAHERRLPFEIKAPNTETALAMDELDRGCGHLAGNVPELINSLNADN
jgi:DNA-damage-inducible protein J